MDDLNVYYSQHGEDFLLDKIFREKGEGYFVEVGCLDGIEYSNSYYFERKGWKGACIEAHNDFIISLRNNRPGASIVHCAVGEDNRNDVVFYANKAGSLSTLDKSEEDRWKKNYADDFHGFEEQRVSMRTLTSIFDELKVSHIDFVSLDIEGYEVMALKGLDFSKHKPRVFVIEYKDEVHKGQLEEILFKNDYHFLTKVGCNLFYSLYAEDEQPLNMDYGKVKLVKIDHDGNRQYREVDFSKPSFIHKLKSVVRKRVLNKLK